MVDHRSMLQHRTFVAQGVPNPWEVDDGMPTVEFLKRHGLQPKHRLLDFGCGSLRIGRWLIEYLSRGKYFGIDPNTWLIEDAKEHEIPTEIWKAKRPKFNTNNDWDLDVFGKKFDYVFASNVLVHAAHCQITKLIHELDIVLAPGGMGLVNILQPGEGVAGGHYGGDVWQYPSVSLHSPECLTGHGLECETIDVLHGSGLTLHWFKLTRMEEVT